VLALGKDIYDARRDTTSNARGLAGRGGLSSSPGPAAAVVSCRRDGVHRDNRRFGRGHDHRDAGADLISRRGTMTRTGNRTKGAIMLNGKSYEEQFIDDPAYAAPTRPRAPYSAELFEVLAALEDDLRIILRQTFAPPSGERT